MKKRIFNKIIAILLYISMLCSSFVQVSAQDEKIQYLKMQMMKYDSNACEYVLDGEINWVNAININGCVLVDFQAVCDILRIKENGGDYSLENSPTEDEAKAAPIYPGNGYKIGDFFHSYEAVFGVELDETTASDGFFIQKNKNSSMKFYMRNGSDVAYMYGRDTIEIKLGEKVRKVDDHLMVPAIMFFKLIDVDYKIEDDMVCLYPSELTAMDILTANNLNNYNFDIVADTDIENDEYMMKTGGIVLYRKLKDIIQGVVTHDFEKIKTYVDDSSVIAANLADQISQCSVSESDKIADKIASDNMKADTFEVIMTCISDYLVGEEDTIRVLLGDADKKDPGILTHGAEEAYKQILSNWDVAEKELLEKVSNSGDASLESKIETILKHFDAENAALAAEQYKVQVGGSLLEGGTTVVSAAISATVTNCSLVNQIDASVQENVSAFKQYINCYNEMYEAIGEFGGSQNQAYNIVEGRVTMSKGLIDELEKKASMYDGKNTNTWQNEELRKAVFKDVLNSAASVGAGEVAGKFTNSKFIGGWKGILLSFGWYILEIIANNATGKSFDALDALYNSIFAMQLENDSEVITAWYGKQDNMDLYRQLAWLQLKSYYLARMNYVAYCYPNDWKQYETDMPELYRENEGLLEMMAVLMYGYDGVTQENLDLYYENIDNYNNSMKDILLDEIILVEDVYFKTCTYVTKQYNSETGESENVELKSNYHIPKINISGSVVEQINEEIYNSLYPEIEAALLDVNEYGYPYSSEGISYRWAVNGDVLSLIILNSVSPDFGGMHKYMVYNISISTGNIVLNEDIFSIVGLSEDEFYEKAKQVLGSCYWSNWEIDNENFEYQSFVDRFNEQLEKTISDENIKQAFLYINEYGQLCMVAPIYSLADADYYWHDLNMIEFELLPHYNQKAQRITHNIVLSEEDAYRIAYDYWDYTEGDISDEGFELYVTYDGLLETMDGNNYYAFRLRWWVTEMSHMSTIDMLYINAETGACMYTVPEL